MSTTAPEPVQINQSQADAILDFAIKNRMYEVGSEGLEGVDPQTRVNDAATLTYQAKRAFDHGNSQANVMEVLFIAEVEQRPIDGSVPAPAQAPAPPATPVASAPVETPGAQYAENSDEQLAQALDVLGKSPSSPAVATELASIQAELERRASAQAAPAQAVAPPTQPPAPVPAPGPSPAGQVGQQPAAAPTPAPAPPVPPVAVPSAPITPQSLIPPSPTDLPPVPGLQRSGVVSAGGLPDTGGPASFAPEADAAPVPAPQAAQSSSQGGVPVPAAPAQNGADPRAQLVGQLTYGMLQAYGLTMEAAAQLPADQLQSILANPGGPQVPAAVPVAESDISPEREALEARVVGPMLKAWKRGRKDIPKLSDEELKTMVENPAGPATLPQGDPFLDPNTSQAPDPGNSVPPAPIAPAAPPQQQDAQVAAVPEQPIAPPPAVAAPAPPSPAPEPVAVQPPAVAAPVERTPSQSGSVSKAMQIIKDEHLPIPPDIDEPYRLPNDVSKVSDEELRSLHARAHAVEARVNWVISESDDEIGDLERLLADRRRVVKLETPTTADGKRLTKDQIEARVEADDQVQGLLGQIKDIQKTTSKLKVIRDNSHRDCERMSRQFSMRYGEEKAGPAR